MNSPIDEQTMTAYALGELSAAEAKVVEDQLNADALAEIHGIQDLAHQLQSEFSAETNLRLSDSQRENILNTGEPAMSPFIRRPLFIFGLSTAAAACLVGVLFIQSQNGSPLTKPESLELSKRTNRWHNKSISQSAEEKRVLTKEVRRTKMDALGRSGGHISPPKRPGPMPVANPIIVLGEESSISKNLPKGTGLALERDRSSKPIALARGDMNKLREYEAVKRLSKKKFKQAGPQQIINTSPSSSQGKPQPTTPMEPYVERMPQARDPVRQLQENPFKSVSQDPLSTFSIDVDTASYSNVRRYLKRHTRLPARSIRIEEMINYFHYDYNPPSNDDPFAAHIEVSQCPWNLSNRLVRVGIKGKVIAKEQRPVSNLVFLIDVSGSMGSSSKLPLLVEGMTMLVKELGENDRVAIAVYAGASGLVLPSTSCTDKSTILNALRRLRSGGSTNGGAGIQLAYQTAVANFVEGGTNRVILATDGDFNVGTTSRRALVTLIKDRAKTGVFLTVLGFGMNNRDHMLEQIANKGNGHYAIIDNRAEAKKVLVDELSGTLVTIAKDVKLQVEFNPKNVKSYRLIGYENRMLAHQDFNNDKKDAGEIGAGHTVTALYEVVLGTSKETQQAGVDPLKYQDKKKLSEAGQSTELLTLKIRYKKPDGDKSKLLRFPVVDSAKSYSASSNEFKFAASVAAFGMLLRDSKHKGIASFPLIKELAMEGKGSDKNGYRAEFISLIDKAQTIYKR
jgi:Ca-activated chloride channel homolog